jgi:hypothetical protein
MKPRNRNPGTRLGRPPIIKPITAPRTPTGEKQGLGPSEMLDTAVPGAAFKRGGSVMPRHHDDPDFYKRR